MIQEKLAGLGHDVISEAAAGKYPTIRVPSRSVKNILYDISTQQYVIGEQTTLRSSGSVSSAKGVMQLLWLADTCSELVRDRRTTTMRDLYYAGIHVMPDMFVGQPESDKVIFDLESILGAARESFGVVPDSRNSIYGDMEIEYTAPNYEGKQMRLDSIPGGMIIGPPLATAEFGNTSAECIICVEKTGTFTRLYEDGIPQRYNALIVDLNGQASRNCRIVLHKLYKKYNLPMYIFTDADPYGEYIARVLISGSAQAAHLRGLVVPTAKWLGVWSTDIDKYNLSVIPMEDVDIRKCNSMAADPRFASGIWAEQLAHFKRYKKKAELEAFAQYGLTYITERYIPERLEEATSL